MSAGLLLVGCKSDSKAASTLATQQVHALGVAAKEDVMQIRRGLPVGAEEIAKLLPEKDEEVTPELVREMLGKARNKSQDLRVAKSTFFAFASTRWDVLRTDQEQDRLAGKNMLSAFPVLAGALGGTVETSGTMPEISEVRGKPDGQWVAAGAVKSGEVPRGFYVTGWSWSAYAYRLENAARSNARAQAESPQKVPLVYAFVVVNNEVYAAAVTPDVNTKAVKYQLLNDKLNGKGAVSVELDITGRHFGLAAEAAPELGTKVAIAVLCSET